MSNHKSNLPDESDPRLVEALNFLNQIGNAINNIRLESTQQDVSLSLIAESVIHFISGSSAAIYTYDDTTGTIDRNSRISAEPPGRKDHYKILEQNDAPRINGIGMRTIHRKQSTYSYVDSDVNIHPYHAARGVKAVVCFPLIVAEQVVGIFYINLYEERKFTPLEQLMIDNFVNQAAMSIYHSKRLTHIRRDLLRKNEELNQLRRAGLLISSRLRLEETLDSILDLALEITHAQYGIFRLLDKLGESLVTKAVSGLESERPLVEKLPVHGKSIMAHVARTRKPLLVGDLRQEPWSDIYYPLISKFEMRSELAVPLINASGRLEGVLNLESPQPNAFSDADNHLLQSLATYAITAIQEVRLLDAMQEAAQLLVSQPMKNVLDRLCEMAGDLLSSPSSAIWLGIQNEEIRLAASHGLEHPPEYPPNSEDPKTLLLPLMAGEEERALGVFGVFNPNSKEGRSAYSDWDRKVLTCLANYAVLTIQNEAHLEALRTSQEQHWTAETFAAVGDISANLLHNMNNKVGTIPVRVQSIEEKYKSLLETDPYLANTLTEIERSAADAMRVVQENLSFLRPIQLGKVRIPMCVTDAIRSVSLPKGIRIELSGLDELPTILAGNQSLTFVFINIIDNAISALRGNGTIAIKGIALSEWVEVAITDDGPGIAPELHEQIFELNYSGQSNSNNGKLGFGLWWVKTLMTRLGGSVSIESDGHHGTTFRLRLPISPEKAAE